MIQDRSGEEFDNIYGPIVVCLALVVALCLNFGLRVSNLDCMSLAVPDDLQYQAVLHSPVERYQSAVMYQDSQIDMSYEATHQLQYETF